MKRFTICLKCGKIKGFTYYYQGFYRCGEFPPSSNKKICDYPVYELTEEIAKKKKKKQVPREVSNHSLGNLKNNFLLWSFYETTWTISISYIYFRQEEKNIL